MSKEDIYGRLKLRQIHTYRFYYCPRKAYDHIMRHFIYPPENWKDLVEMHLGKDRIRHASKPVTSQNVQRVYDTYLNTSRIEYGGVCRLKDLEDFVMDYADRPKSNKRFRVMVSLFGVLLFFRRNSLVSSFRMPHKSKRPRENNAVRYARFLKAWDYARTRLIKSPLKPDEEPEWTDAHGKRLADIERSAPDETEWKAYLNEIRENT